MREDDYLCTHATSAARYKIFSLTHQQIWKLIHQALEKLLNQNNQSSPAPASQPDQLKAALCCGE